MPVPLEVKSPFKHGEGYFSLRNYKDSSGMTVITHPQASINQLIVLTSPLGRQFKALDNISHQSQDIEIQPEDIEILSISNALSWRGSDSSLSNLSSLLSSEDEAEVVNASLTPLKVHVSDSSPYNHHHKIKLYNGKPDQFWYYVHSSFEINTPPKAQKTQEIPKNTLFICDVMDKGRCTKRRIWINSSDKKPKWVVAQGADALQTFGGREYGFHMCEDGPCWVLRETPA
ncbi:hypothetical protein P691DRAFT_764453 [Macrolepiota fuliginosa MF-IS2]|uniref:Uncharacterized protein n=1 Tax=Macrolepiota fuliginosa MF-IS2 TaxID=1400762 RepID=A0A9P5X2E1_9AGAR|nr:hypothetical protein P691DRAFT_764453 [Macrolepiota fuliginosa MF-IS2]